MVPLTSSVTVTMPTSEIVAYSVAIVSVLSAIASAVLSFRNTATGMKDDIIQTYEKRLAQMDKDIKDLTKKVDDLTTNLALSENNRKAAEAILQGRNPELDGYMARTEKMLTEVHAAVLPQTVSPNA